MIKVIARFRNILQKSKVSVCISYSLLCFSHDIEYIKNTFLLVKSLVLCDVLNRVLSNSRIGDHLLRLNGFLVRHWLIRGVAHFICLIGLICLLRLFNLISFFLLIGIVTLINFMSLVLSSSCIFDSFCHFTICWLAKGYTNIPRVRRNRVLIYW